MKKERRQGNPYGRHGDKLVESATNQNTPTAFNSSMISIQSHSPKSPDSISDTDCEEKEHAYESAIEDDDDSEWEDEEGFNNKEDTDGEECKLGRSEPKLPSTESLLILGLALKESMSPALPVSLSTPTILRHHQHGSWVANSPNDLDDQALMMKNTCHKA